MAAQDEYTEAPSFATQSGTDVVTFEVGANGRKRLFTTNIVRLFQKAPQFEKLFDDPYLVCISQKYFLAEDDPRAFELFISWLHLGKLDITVNVQDSTMIELFAFAEKYKIPDLADETMDNFCKAMSKFHQHPRPILMSLAYKRTQKKSKMRLYMARSWVFITTTLTEAEGNDPAWKNDSMRSVLVDNEDLWTDTLALLRGSAGIIPPDPSQAPRCDYHQHGDNIQCPHRSTNNVEIPAPDISMEDVSTATRENVGQLGRKFPNPSIKLAQDTLRVHENDLVSATEAGVNSVVSEPSSTVVSETPRKRRRLD
ncbi:hypothetical protein PZA11_001962 [Diplocarpon coronariae]|uniref:Uncharacterized protein n=1 Tax=Diplocarpon coronariae TaxID=2795749 RepID=A0A218Z8C8_9HELO|nr:hypothetical protein JHW43_001778 [Diplocarpon mali]OWP03505.1 hypothetical protein B2J93_7523 [Marssonina coronariae]